MKAETPASHSHRTILRIVESFHGGLPYDEAQYDEVCRVFGRMGGSWSRISGGSVEDFQLLKRVISIAVKHGFLGKKAKQ